ncbi:hypothetical protein [Ramlibacter henchirensis]|nr:hypothetical protein [Ramlibacter henchirensis]
MFDAHDRFVPRSADFGAEDAGLVGTPYFKVGIAGAVIAWAALMLSLWW